MSDTEKQILHSVADHLGLSMEDLNRTTHLRDDLELGPIELNDLLNVLSEKFNVTFDSEDTNDLQTIDDLIILVEDNLI